MADHLMRAQVTLHHGSGVPENDAVNTWYFDGDDFPGQDDALYWAAVDDELLAFYQAIAPYMSNVLTGTYTLKIYDMADPIPRVPEFVADRSFAAQMQSHQSLPGEVAVCASFAATPQSGIPAGRLRGRIYIGPLNVSAVTQIGTAVRVVTAFRDLIATKMADLRHFDFSGPSGTAVNHSIYSPTIDATQTLGEAFNDVVRGWVDDACDTQRRRGEKATARSTWT